MAAESIFCRSAAPRGQNILKKFLLLRQTIEGKTYRKPGLADCENGFSNTRRNFRKSDLPAADVPTMPYAPGSDVCVPSPDEAALWNNFEVHTHAGHCLGSTTFATRTSRLCQQRLFFCELRILPEAFCIGNSRNFLYKNKLPAVPGNASLPAFHPLPSPSYSDCLLFS